MPFPFTFSLSVPGIPNPFSAQGQGSFVQSEPNPSRGSVDPASLRTQHVKPGPRRRPSPVHSIVSPVVPLSRKRGWEPSLSGPSLAATSSTSSAGYLDTPAKYREMASEPSLDRNRSRDQIDREIEEMAAELPPNKRRRTLVGSIASTALSAALIGSAVGLTVYRLWRDRGKESESLPPPPAYEQGEWVPPHQQAQTVASPPTPRPRKVRNTPAAKRAATRHRRARTAHSAMPSSSSTQPEFDFSRVDHADDDPEDQMDWIGDKLTQLIQEGQKALGREVVVASEAQEDEIDDGAGAWEEEQEDPYRAGSSSNRSTSRSGSVRRQHRPHNIPLPIPSQYSPRGATSLSPSPRPNRFDALPPFSASYSQSIPIPGSDSFQRGPSVESGHFPHSASTSFREDESAWQSPELRESMAQARARYLANRR